MTPEALQELKELHAKAAVIPECKHFFFDDECGVCILQQKEVGRLTELLLTNAAELIAAEEELPKLREFRDGAIAFNARIAELEAERDSLKQQLYSQWLSNHAEHCTNEYPHNGDCHWPLPEQLATRI